MTDTPKLRPCPACGNEAVAFPGGSGCGCYCYNTDCMMVGPHADPTGSKWNALPRRDDVKPDDDEALLVEFAKAAATGMLANGLWWEMAQSKQDFSVSVFLFAAAMLEELKRRRGAKP